MRPYMRLIAILLVVVLAAAGAFAVLGGGSATEDEPRGTNGSTSDVESRGPATGALYLSGKTLSHVDLDSGASERIGRMPTMDVFASPVTSWLAYVVARTPQEEQEPDFIPDPVLRVINVDTGKDREIGEGFNPLWHSTEPKLAYLRPVIERECSGESCTGLSEIATYDVASGARAVLTEPGSLNLLAWSDERVLYANEADLSVTFSVDMEGNVETLDLAPNELWDASPDGRYLVRSAPGEAALIDLEKNDEIEIDIGNGVLSEGAWAPNSRLIAAAVLNGNRTRARAVLVGVSDGGITTYTQNLPGVLNVRWSPDSREFGFLTFVGATNQVELNRCPVDQAVSDCTTVGETLRRTTLLRFD